MQLGDEFIELTQYLTPTGRPIPRDAHSNDRSFQHIAIIVSDMDQAHAVLRKNNVEAISSAPQRLPDWNKNAAGIRAFYFHDPDGHPLEILQFPAGKGREKWHVNSSQLFLGIDHTAIVVGDTDASLHFYRDLLGMRVVGESDNYGVEQERLNNVPGAHLRITSLRADAGPGVELLQYLSPQGGQPFPSDEHANDLVHHKTVVLTNDADAAAKKIANKQAKFVSSGVVSESDGQSGFSKAFLVRDPDGHPVLVEQK
jgi:catechol 2,3-dioxygenase-like lactoylglutathione lyase family enzyme